MIFSANSLAIARLEIRCFLRSRSLLVMLFLLWLLLVVAGVGGYRSYKTLLNDQLAAQQIMASEWTHQARNPHAAAHWGTYLFKPYPFISLFEAGLVPFTGNYYRVEAHRQQQVNAVNLTDKEAFLQLGNLTVATMFQQLVPLFIVFLGFASLTRERERQTLRLLLAQGVSPGQLLRGKLMGHYTIVLLMTVPVFLLLFTGLLSDSAPEPQLLRLLLLCLVYAIYFFTVTATVVLISFYSRSSGASLITCTSCWIFFILLFPKLAAGKADQTYPLPTAYQFEHSVKEGFDKGLGNDGNYVDRSDAYLRRFLLQYGVDSIKQLPENIALGLDLLQSERYQYKVYRHYASPVEYRIGQQQRLLDLSGLMDPLVAVQQLSMGFAGTDFYHHLDFYRHAQVFRNEFNETLNKRLLVADAVAKGSAFTESQAFYRNMKPFRYRFPSVGTILVHHYPALLSLLLCMAVLLLLLAFPKRINLQP